MNLLPFHCECFCSRPGSLIWKLPLSIHYQYSSIEPPSIHSKDRRDVWYRYSEEPARYATVLHYFLESTTPDPVLRMWGPSFRAVLFRANSRSPLQRNCIIVWNCHPVAFQIGDWRAPDVCPRLFRESTTPDPVLRMWGPPFRAVLFRANGRSPLQKNCIIVWKCHLVAVYRKSLTASSRSWCASAQINPFFRVFITRFW